MLPGRKLALCMTAKYSRTSPPSPDTETNVSGNTAFAVVLERRLSRRRFLSASTGTLLLPLLPAGCELDEHRQPLVELPQGRDADFHVAPEHRYQVLLRWGDPLFANAPGFDPYQQSAATQSRQFGCNNDFIAFMPLPHGGRNSYRGLLVVNHEFTLSELMFPGSPTDAQLTRAQIDVEIAAHGMSVTEVERRYGEWLVRRDSDRNRRITPLTSMRFSGPAAGNERLRCATSPDGIHTRGTFGNCAGGVTPWGTVLSAEENVQQYFVGNPEASAEAASHRRYGVAGDAIARFEWGRHHPRWHLDENPAEPLQAGWIVEVDPYDPASVPVKRTALGRCRHEACTTWLNGDGRVIAYSGDDQVFEYIYRFVSRDRYRPGDRTANRRLLDDGELSAAEFRDDGRLVWHPLVYGQGPLTAANGFNSQADVVIDMRRAADLVGATPMDRPEDIEVNPVTCTVFAMLTRNPQRETASAANPRAANPYGHILELLPPDGNHAAPKFRWELFILAGNPAEPAHNSEYHPAVSEHGWFAAPDNCAFDRRGRLWIATDGANQLGIADGLWVCEVTGPERALPRHFLRTPVGSELCGPCFTPDNRSLFVAVQHPGEHSRFDEPSTRWPDFREGWPPRPAVVVIERESGGAVG